MKEQDEPDLRAVRKATGDGARTGAEVRGTSGKCGEFLFSAEMVRVHFLIFALAPTPWRIAARFRRLSSNQHTMEPRHPLSPQSSLESDDAQWVDHPSIKTR
jgi:hypothetical protein